MSRLHSSTEQTWSQLQERLRKSRERQSPIYGAGVSHAEHGIGTGSRRSVPPNPLPRIESPSHPDSLGLTSPELRGGYFPRVPPVTSNRAQQDDTLSLDSYNSDSAQEPTLAPPNPTTPPTRYPNGTSHSDPDVTHRRVPAWDQYTGRRTGTEMRDARDGPRRGKKKKYYVRQGSANFEDDVEDLIAAKRVEVAGRNRDRYSDHFSRNEGPRLVEYDNVFGGRELVRIPNQRQESSAFIHMQDELFARTFLEYFLTSCLQDDLILEVAIDVMSEVREDRDLERQLSQPVLDIGREILDEVVQESVRDVAYIELRASVKSFWHVVLESPDLYKPIARDLIREVIDEEVSSLVPASISDLVTEYFVQKDVVVDFRVICDEVIVDLLPDIILEAVYDESIESLLEGIIHDEIVSFASCFVEDTFATGRPKIPMSPCNLIKEQEEIKSLADDFLLDAAIFENLLMRRLLPNHRVWNAEDYLDLYMDSLLLDQVLGQELELMKRRDSTERCLPLKRFHEKICTNVAIDVVLEELMGHLDEDMAEMDEYEMEIDRTTKFKPP